MVRGRPLVVFAAQAATCLFIVRCLMRIGSGHAYLLYGRWSGPLWIDAVLAAGASLCLLMSARRERHAMFIAAVPAAVWLILTLCSPESYTAWLWIPSGGPREPWGAPRELTYQFRYHTYEQLVGSCVSTVVIEIALAAFLVWFFTTSRAREYYGIRMRA